MTRNNRPGFRVCNGPHLHTVARIHWRASLVPAAAVIPAPIACVKIVAVKKLVVGLLEAAVGPRPLLTSSFCKQFLAFTGWFWAQILSHEETRVFQAGSRRNTLAWNMLRLLLPPSDWACLISRRLPAGPKGSPDHSVGRSDGRCVQRAGT